MLSRDKLYLFFNDYVLGEYHYHEMSYDNKIIKTGKLSRAIYPEKCQRNIEKTTIYFIDFEKVIRWDSVLSIGPEIINILNYCLFSIKN